MSMSIKIIAGHAFNIERMDQKMAVCEMLFLKGLVGTQLQYSAEIVIEAFVLRILHFAVAYDNNNNNNNNSSLRLSWG